MNGSYSICDDIFSSIPQGSILGLLLFDMYIWNLFSGIGDLDIAICADDNTHHTLCN